jgi:3-oxoacyl-[acyl-carrier-protein] synthase II
VRKRVVVTGMGVISSAGNGCAPFLAAVSSARQTFSPIGRPHLSHLRATHAGIINNFDETGIALNPCLGALDPFVHFAEASCREAIGQAGIDPASLGSRIGLVFATCSGPMQTIERHYGRIISGAPSLTAGQLFAKRYYSGAKALAHIFRIRGPSATVVTACSASCAAIGIGADLIRSGCVDVVLAGGSDTLSETTLAGFDGLKATCSGQCAPFSKPSGLNLGEAAAFVVLESLDSSRRRRAEAHAEILGFGLSNDAYHCTAPEPSGAGQMLAMERAVRDAGVELSDISYINAHGTGTDANDKTETRAIRKVFGGLSARIPVSSTKSMVGHCLGAAGALETVASILCLKRGTYPPTANFSEPRDGCTLDYVTRPGRGLSSDGPMIKNNFAFGGNNASLVLTHRIRPDEALSQSVPEETIVITGIGLVSAAGIGNEQFCSGLMSGAAFFSEQSVSETDTITVGMVPEFDMGTIDRRLDDRAMDRSSRFATAAARLALSHSAFPDKQSFRRDLGLYLHLSAGPSWAESEHIGSLLRENFHISQVNAFPYIVPNSVAGIVCKSLNLSGHNTTLCFGPGAGLAGLSFAESALLNGHAQALINLSADELSPRIMADLASSGLAASGRQPYGEGACAFVIETERHARARNATILARICASSLSTETEKFDAADGDGSSLQATIAHAIGKAGVAPTDIGAVCLNSASARVQAGVAAVLGKSGRPWFDCSPQIGFAEATQPLYTMAYAILGSSFEPELSKKYILVVFGSDTGINCATVIRKE